MASGGCRHRRYRCGLPSADGNLLVSFIIGVCACLGSIAAAANDDTIATERGGEYCETEIFRAACGDNEAILLVRARYGRMRLGRCVEFDLGYIDCYTDVLTRLDKRCSGRRTCQVRIPDAEFESTGPCLKELKTYLEVSYLCVPVEVASSERCTSSSFINVTVPTGYISSRPTVEPSSAAEVLPSSFELRPSSAPPSSSRSVSSTSPETDIFVDHPPLHRGPSSPIECDHSTQPWVVMASRGQRINLTLYDFALDEAHVTNAQRTHESGRICRQYGWIDDSAFDRPRPLCAGDRRVTQLDSSRGHVVKIWTMSPIRSASGEALETTRFMIKYTVVGCPDPELVPEHTWFERNADGNSATMGCVNAEVKWSVFCVSNLWVGYHANCTTIHEPQHRDDHDHSDDGAIPYGLAIGVGAVIGVFIALVIVVIIGFRRRDTRRGTRDASRTSHHHAASSDKRANHYNHQQRQQLQLRQLEDYTYYASSGGCKPTSTGIYDCPCGTGDGGAPATTTIETCHSVNDLYTGDRRRPTTTSRFNEAMTLPTCDLCAIQQRPAAMFEYVSGGAGGGSSTYYDCVPWQASTSTSSSMPTYSRLPIVSQPGNTEIGRCSSRPRVPVSGTPDVEVGTGVRTAEQGRSITSLADAELTTDEHVSGRLQPEMVMT